MAAPKNLLDLSNDEQIAFLESFDTVFCDVDGVVWGNGFHEIIGATEGIKALRNLGKKMYFVTNNSTAPLDVFMKRMEKFEVSKEEIIRPANALAWYLKKLNFDKEVYVVGFRALKDELKNAGFKVVYDEMTPTGETIDTILIKLKDIRPNVGAVILDFAVNIDFMGLQKCVTYIRENNALFLVGAWDPIISFRGQNLIGTSHFAKAIEEATGKAPKILSKPGKEFNEVLEENLGPYNPSRILFIGDSAVTDMMFAANHGYQKLLPLTGYITDEDLKNWKHDEKCKPDYIVDSITAFDTIVTNLGLETLKL